MSVTTQEKWYDGALALGEAQDLVRTQQRLLVQLFAPVLGTAHLLSQRIAPTPRPEYHFRLPVPLRVFLRRIQAS